MNVAQSEEKLFIEPWPQEPDPKALTLAHIVEQWIRKLLAGDIKYDPEKVESRWVSAAGGNSGRLKAIRNGSRKDRLAKKAA